MATLNPYGKLDEAEHERLLVLRKSRRRITVIALSSIILIGIVVAATIIGVTQTNKNNNTKSENSPSSSIKAICNTTLHPDSCYTSLSPLLKNGKVKPLDLFKLSVRVALDELSAASNRFDENRAKQLTVADQPTVAAMTSCQELLSLAIDHLNNSLSVKDVKLFDVFDDLMTWLSSAGTYQQTCIDDLEDASTGISGSAINNFKNSSEYTSNSLAILSSLVDSIDTLGDIVRGRRRLMSFGGPGWVSGKDRRLLQSPSSNIKADAVVAKDRSGKYTTITAALAAVPEKSKKRFVIYVKKGVYNENVRVEKKMWNVMMVGDGKGATVVSGGLTLLTALRLFKVLHLPFSGKGLLLGTWGFETRPARLSTSGCLNVDGRFLDFLPCTMDAFQDTLYVHSNRQFYRECDIYGTVDFIFGNSAVVIQNCNIRPKLPMQGQQNTITAQGKIDPNQNTGLSIQNCTILPAANLTGVKTFLGRPWKNYSTTVMFQNVLGGFIEPTGWMPWVGTSAPDTIFYAEFQNTGPGAVTRRRVNWKGLKLNLNANQVKKYTVGSFLQGGQVDFSNRCYL